MIEALVAVSIVAIALSSIGALIATTVRGTRSIEAHLSRLEVARIVITALPERDQLVDGNLSGATSGHDWSINVARHVSTSDLVQPRTSWVPQNVIVTVQSPAGAPMQIHTVRLRRNAGP
jgi:general secretion pathway protein I